MEVCAGVMVEVCARGNTPPTSSSPPTYRAPSRKDFTHGSTGRRVS